jgi:outer membrane protein assembly factor BamB
LDAWPENGPELLWVYEGIGRGYAAPAVLHDRLFINGEKDGEAYLYAFDLHGKELWRSHNGKEFLGHGYSSNYPGARATPTVKDDLVYTTSGTGRIACFDAATGEEKWAVDKNRDLGGMRVEFGYSESLAIDDEKVYCFPGGKRANMAAIDRFTGKTVWTSTAKQDTFSYCSPIIVPLQARQILISTSRHSLFALDCSNGKLLASYPLKGFKWDGDHCNTPIYADGHAYFIASEKKGKGAVKLALTHNGTHLKEVWHNREVMNNFGGFIKLGDNLFTTVRGRGLKVLEIDRGTVVNSLKIPDGSLICADDKFICYGTNGVVNLVRYDQGRLEVRGTFEIAHGNGQHFSHPVVSRGILYIRHGNALMAYRIK